MGRAKRKKRIDKPIRFDAGGFEIKAAEGEKQVASVHNASKRTTAGGCICRNFPHPAVIAAEGVKHTGTRTRYQSCGITTASGQ